MVVVILVVVGVILLIHPQSISIQSYADCSKAEGSTIQTSYPTVCITKDKKRFTNPSENITKP